MLITINSDYRDADEAYMLFKYLRDGIGFKVIEDDFTISKLYKFDPSIEEIKEIMIMIADYLISVEIDFKR